MHQINNLLIDRPSPRRRRCARRVLQSLIAEQSQSHEHERAVRADDAVVRHRRSDGTRQDAQTPVMDVVENVGMAVAIDAKELADRLAGDVGVWSIGEELLELL